MLTSILTIIFGEVYVVMGLIQGGGGGGGH